MILLALLAAIGLGSRESSDDVAGASVKLVKVGRFEQPVHVASPLGDGRVFVVERAGRIRVLVNGRRLRRPFLDLAGRVSSQGREEGLLSVAFSPDYATSGRFYVDYTDRRHRSIVEEYGRSSDPNRADPRSARRVLVVRNPTDQHHGGLILFGPDGHLYVGQGDGGDRTDPTLPAQRLDNLRGKILRIDPRRSGGRAYGIPDDNPFVGRAGRDEIWLYGLRNPWRFAFDSASGALVIGDVGTIRVEELDVADRGGLNFGWGCFEGTVPYDPLGVSPHCPGAVPPAFERFRVPTATVEPRGEPRSVTRGRPPVRVRFARGEGVCSVVAGVTVSNALPSLAGRFLFGDFCDPAVWSLRLVGGRVVDPEPLGIDIPGLSSFGLDAEGRVYMTSLAGFVYRLVPR